MEPSQRELIPVHLLPDSERLLRAHNEWAAAWDQSGNEEEEFDFEAQVKNAYNHYSDGLSPIQVRWRLQQENPLLPARQIARVQRAAERALLAAESAPPELRRAMVAAGRQQAIQGALRRGDWGSALRGLDRAGEIAGELRESAGLSEEDLVLVVTVEDPAPPPLLGEASETGHVLTGETGETPAEP
jgi:hypothetical protein